LGADEFERFFFAGFETVHHSAPPTRLGDGASDTRIPYQ
jgi:hypothetical protein